MTRTCEVANSLSYFNARGRNRTCKGLPPRDFKSLAFTSFATRAEDEL